MNYVIGHGPNKKNKQDVVVLNNPFLALKEKMQGKLTDELMQDDGISPSLKDVLLKMGIHKVPVLKNGFDFVTVEVNGMLSDIPTTGEKISRNSDVFVKTTNRGPIILSSSQINEEMKLAKIIEKRQEIVSKAWDSTRGKTAQTNKTLFNNLLRDNYQKSNKETFYNTMIKGEELIGKVTDIKPYKDHFMIVTVNFNDKSFGKIMRERAAARQYDGNEKDLQYNIGDYCFVNVRFKGINIGKNNAKVINLNFKHNDLDFIPENKVTPDN